MPPPEPKKQPRGGSVAPSETADKHGRYWCPVCERSVGGGEAGSWQHRRSPYHLACYAYHMSHKQKSWGQCQNEGKQWSKDLKDNNSDPPEDPDVIQVKKKDPAPPKKKRQTAPAPIRADPKRWDDYRDDKERP